METRLTKESDDPTYMKIFNLENLLTEIRFLQSNKCFYANNTLTEVSLYT